MALHRLPLIVLLAILIQACNAKPLKSETESAAQNYAVAPVPTDRRLQTAADKKASEAIFGGGKVTTTMPLTKLIAPILGGVAGAAAIGGVIALSVTHAHPQGGKVFSHMTLQVPDASAFLKDLPFQEAVKAGIADAAGVPSSYITLTPQAVGGRRLLRETVREGGRRLLESVKIPYEINIPHDAQQSAADVEKRLGSKSAASLTNAIQNRVTIAKGTNTRILVVDNKAGNQQIVTQAPTTTLPGISTNNGGGTTDNFLSLPSSQTGPGTVALTTPAIKARAEDAGSSGAISGGAGLWIGIGAVLAACLLAACLAVICHKFCGSRTKKATRSARPRQEYDDKDDKQPLMDRRGTRLDLPATAPEMASAYAQPDYASQYTGSVYAPASQYAPMGAPMSGMMSLGPGSVMGGMQSMPPPPPPPAPGGYQASPLANTMSPIASAVVMPTAYEGLTTSQYGLRPGQPGYNQPGLVGVNLPPTMYG